MSKPEINLTIDSGAYSAWSLGRNVDIKAYTEFLQQNSNEVSHAVNLDVIIPKDPEKAAAAGWENLCYMRDAGINAMPVFHARESLKWLDKMLDTTDYIGLSGTSLVSPLEARIFNELCWHYCTDMKGRPIAKFHSFGDTSAATLLNEPFYSADSATWMIQAGMAARIKLQGKSYQFRSTKVRDSSYIHSDDEGPKKESWHNELRGLGLDPEIAMTIEATQSEIAMIRSYLVASDLMQLQEKTRPITRFRRPLPLVLKKKKMDGGKDREGVCKIFLVLSPSAWYFNLPLAYVLGCKNLLVSYFYVSTAPKKFWPERLLPFLYDPKGFCETEPKLRKYYDKIQECLLKVKEVQAVPV